MLLISRKHLVRRGLGVRISFVRSAHPAAGQYQIEINRLPAGR